MGFMSVCFLLNFEAMKIIRALYLVMIKSIETLTTPGMNTSSPAPAFRCKLSLDKQKQPTYTSTK